uniref:EboA domain-containing protein n=1 Tax=Shewanella gaetbuli TaxID=220752 RepID=UPI003B59B51E
MIKLKNIQLEIIEIITAYVNEEQLQWLKSARNKLKSSSDLINELLMTSSTIRRSLNVNDVNEKPLFINDKYYSLDVIVRCLLILDSITVLTNSSKSACQAETVNKIVKDYYQFGDEHEKCALLSTLYIFDTQGDALSTAIRACRCNSHNEYSAIAIDNPYPARFFPEANFNQLVLKSLFMGLNIKQIQGLKERLNETLSNMSFRYAIEQALANRVPPASLWYSVRLDDLNKENKQLQQQYLEHFKQACSSHRETILSLFETAE